MVNEKQTEVLKLQAQELEQRQRALEREQADKVGLSMSFIMMRPEYL